MILHFRYDKCVIILQLPHGSVGQVSRLTGAQKSTVSGQDLGMFPRGKSGVWKGSRKPREEYRGRKKLEVIPTVRDKRKVEPTEVGANQQLKVEEDGKKMANLKAPPHPDPETKNRLAPSRMQEGGQGAP